ncbi:MAG: hypothetical protein V4688_07410 [Pseudomonadota bacterium]
MKMNNNLVQQRIIIVMALVKLLREIIELLNVAFNYLYKGQKIEHIEVGIKI